MGNIIEAFKAFWLVLTGKAAPLAAAGPDQRQSDKSVSTEQKKPAPTPPAKETAPKELFENGAVYALALLQREGRLVDFLKEDITGYDDAQVGAAVRQIHAGCRKVIEENFQLRPVVDAPEGQPFTVPASFDPAEFRLAGDVPATSPLKGTLQHKGWMAAKVSLPSRTGKINPKIVLPAEVSF